MTQLLLDLKPEQIPALDNFIAGNNTELLGRLRGLANPGSFDLVYLWGPEGCGRTHLLAATAHLAAARRPVTTSICDESLVPGSLLVIDDIDRLDDASQVTLFQAFNSARFAGLAILLSGPLPPRDLSLREDLRTRIGQTLIYEIKPLSDEEKTAALRHHAWIRGMRPDDGIFHYLLRHGRRDLPSLMAVLDGLDRASMEQKRPATLPLLKQVMQLQLESEPE